MKKLNLLVLVLSLMMCTGCAQRRTVPEDMGVSDVGETDIGASAGNEAVSNEEMTSPEQADVIDVGQEENIACIPDTPLEISEDYYSAASEQGTLERLEYTTYESFSYEERTKVLTKNTYVYLPYGYSEDKQYNVFYLMHGGWANETTYLGTPENSNVFQNVVDHVVQDGRMEPVIIICPTFNNESPNDSDDYGLELRLTDNYHNELINDLIPAVEGKDRKSVV